MLNSIGITFETKTQIWIINDIFYVLFIYNFLVLCHYEVKFSVVGSIRMENGINKFGQ